MPIRNLGSRRRILLSPEERAARAVANAERVAARIEAAMTCQICGRTILATTGKIAHHGYQRPGGYQTESCAGARELPFESSRVKLDWWIKSLAVMRKDSAQRIADIRDNKLGCFISYKKAMDQTSAFVAEAGNFDEIKKQHFHYFHTRNLHSYEDVKKRHVERLQSELDMLDRDIVEQKKRYEGWKRTYRFIGDAWERI